MLFKKYTKEVLVNDEPLEVTFEVHVDEDEYPEEVPLPEQFIGCITVLATALKIQGVDALGCVYLACNNQFNPKPFEDAVNATLEEFALEDGARSELVGQIQNEYKRLISSAEAFKKYARGSK